MKRVKPSFDSCVIQRNWGEEVVFDSPYLHAFDRLCEVHHSIDPVPLRHAMARIEYGFEYETERAAKRESAAAVGF